MGGARPPPSPKSILPHIVAHLFSKLPLLGALNICGIIIGFQRRVPTRYHMEDKSVEVAWLAASNFHNNSIWFGRILAINFL